MRSNIINQKYQYIHNLFSIKDSNINNIQNSVVKDKDYFIQLSPMESQLLQLLIKMNNVKSIVEVGTLVGYSTACMAACLPNDGHIYTIEQNQYNVEQAKMNFDNCGLSHKITMLHGKALLKLEELIAFSPFDMIFIDADKCNYCNYLDWAELYIKTGGLIVADNTLLFNNVYKDNIVNLSKGISKTSWQVMRNFNDRLSDSSKYLSTLIPTDEGMSVALKLV